MISKIITTIKATLTRILFSAHSLIAVWQVTQNKKDPIYWTLCGPIGLLVIEGLFTLAIKKNQEWRCFTWSSGRFCPSVFLYLSSVVPAIWLLELEKVEKRINPNNNEQVNVTLPAGKQLGINLQIQIDAQTWTTLIEQFLMLILIIGRWLLPKGDLTRDQLSQLLLVYIGTAADIIEFFDSYKDDSIAKVPLLVYLTLGIWSWSLLQFTIVLSATRSRRPRGGGGGRIRLQEEDIDCCNDCCCGIDIWGIALNVILQDAPFLTFRLLIIIHYKIINYMNVFFTCKNTLVILLQLYRLYVVNSEYWKAKREMKMTKEFSRARKQRTDRRYENDHDNQLHDIYIISSGKLSDKKRSKRANRNQLDESDDDTIRKMKTRKERYNKYSTTRKDTGYSTGSSQNMHKTQLKIEKFKSNRKKDKNRTKSSKKSSSSSDNEEIKKIKCKNDERKDDKKKSARKSNKRIEIVEEEKSDTSSESTPKYNTINEKTMKKKKRNKSSRSSSSTNSSSSSSSSSSTSSSEE